MLRFISAWLLYPLAERCQKRQISVKAAALRGHMALPLAERKKWIQARLTKVLARAGQDVPYYRDLFQQLHFEPAKLARDLAYLQDLPCLTKEIIREQGVRMISQRHPLPTLHVRKTGGSTGPSTLIYYSNESLDWTAAVNVVCQQWAGKRRHMREVHLASNFPEIFPWKDRLAEKLKCLALNRGNIYTDSFDPEGLAKTWNLLSRWRPYLIQGHPSTLYALAVYLRERNINARRVFRVFESTGEVLDPKKRECIEAVFDCRAIDRFGSAEFGVVAYERLEDRDRRLKVLDRIAWPEIVTEDDGQNELVCTSLQNDAMPLLRYRTGDLSDLEEAADGFYLKNIVGRVHDVVRIGEHRYPTHYLQDLLDRIGGIDEFQVEQRERGVLLRLVVPDMGQRVAIAGRLRQWWGNAVELDFTDFGGLARHGWRSKFRYLTEPTREAA